MFLVTPDGIIVVDPKKHPAIRGDLANAFVDFIISPPAQQLIRDYTINGEQLFQVTGGFLFTDGFESGDTFAWSTSQ